ncbi:hypothetical protein FKG94_19840 [Exilibacterium tricleocarpae]|uniref:Fido domain-containing protein n=1 Tax=Exilibacterium tricleocarpae TaxID=2591008 RepID=A0A545T1P3_9GAMM|nr:Fic family protein [Exilibacterium tricleocarpae]TQV71141.1 hypothetical protein FKG94_19840 [Exilibacterium tricleocarpae]
MSKSIPKHDLQAIEAVVSAYPQGIAIQNIHDELGGHIARRTLQYRLKHLVDEGRLVKQGSRRWARYLPLAVYTVGETKAPEVCREELVGEVSISTQAAEVQKYVRKPVLSRKPVGYERSFLDSYRPNATYYLSQRERAHLRKVGTPQSTEQPAGTYARQIMNRLLIDLSWNSSRLEGNTYSLLDTKRLINFGKVLEGKKQLETQMILNHKDAIEFLVDSAEEIGFNRYTILNLHALLANNLLADLEAAGRLRRIVVGIEKSAFHPLEVPQLIEAYFDQILATAEAITDPFEQAFFAMVQLPYLQPFDDVNKRVSRLAANIPLIKTNLTPLSFTEVPTKTYTEAILGVYELNRIDLLKDIFIWAYERSAARYAAVRQSLGEPDPFRLKHRTALREIVQTIVLEPLGKRSAFARIAAWTGKNVEAGEQDRFREVAEHEVLGLHAGNFARYQIKPSQFETWQAVWHKPEKL